VIRIGHRDEDLLARVRTFRGSVFAASSRDQRYREAWRGDRYDEDAVHVVRLADGEIVAAVRLTLAGPWPLEETLRFDADKGTGAELGRLCVGQRMVDGHRTLFELIEAACRYCLEHDRNDLYGLVIERFRRAVVRAGIPFVLLSEGVRTYGERSSLVQFNARELLTVHAQRVGV
jgi:hypothetical protein